MPALKENETQLATRFDKELKKKLKAKAALDEMSLRGALEEAVREYLEKE